MATKFKLLAYIGIWLAALVATDPTLGYWSLVWIFPLGLFSFFFPEHHPEGGWTVLIVTAALYVVHAVFYFRARTKKSVLILVGVLLALLFCNVAGCRAMLHGH